MNLETRKPGKSKSGVRGRKASRRWTWILVVIVALLVPPIEVGLVRFFNPPRTRSMVIDRIDRVLSRGAKVPLRYQWIDLAQLPEMFLKHVWISEDQRFFQHAGFDWK